MTYQKKQVELFSHDVTLGTGTNGLYIFHTYLDHVGKINHNISGKFSVLQTNPSQIHDVKFYILNDKQFINWFLDVSSKSSTYLPPPSFGYKSGKTIQNKFASNVKHSGRIYFIFDNRFSSFTKKQLMFNLIEEWEEEINSEIDVVTTIPPHDKSLNERVTSIIEGCKTNLQIITPYIDMSLITELLIAKNNGVSIQIITRPANEFKTKASKDALKYLKTNFKNSHKTNPAIHSRIMLADQTKILVSSADLTHDSLRAQFNAGIISTHHVVVKKMLEYFTTVWQKS